jgi:hypothetical protein
MKVIGKTKDPMEWANFISKMAHTLKVLSIMAKSLVMMVYLFILMAHSREGISPTERCKAPVNLCQLKVISNTQVYGTMTNPMAKV